MPSLNELMNYLENQKFENIRIVDLRNGKRDDDGYSAIHLYYQKPNYHYPIEVQFWNECDYSFHNWLYKYSYKYLNGSEGILLRNLFNDGLINNEEEFLCSLKLINGDD